MTTTPVKKKKKSEQRGNLKNVSNLRGHCNMNV